MRDNDTESLLRLLRAELTAVHQQFCHMLVLRHWGGGELLDRITAIDNVDFRNAMQIIDLLALRGQTVALTTHEFRPGHDLHAIILSEQRMEQRLEALIETLEISDETAKTHAARAAAPRPDYRKWLSAQIAGRGPGMRNDSTPPALAALLGELIALVEQPMLHAFGHWHAGRRDMADNAWRLSGAAMLYAAALVRQAARDGETIAPVTGPRVQAQDEPEAAFRADLNLTRRCAEMGRRAADAQIDEAMRRTCLRIAADCDLILEMEPAGIFPAALGSSPVFESFAATRERHL